MANISHINGSPSMCDETYIIRTKPNTEQERKRILEIKKESESIESKMRPLYKMYMKILELNRKHLFFSDLNDSIVEFTQAYHEKRMSFEVLSRRIRLIIDILETNPKLVRCYDQLLNDENVIDLIKDINFKLGSYGLSTCRDQLVGLLEAKYNGDISIDKDRLNSECTLLVFCLPQRWKYLFNERSSV